MILAYKKTLGKFTKDLGFEKTPPPFGKIPKKIPFFGEGGVHKGYRSTSTVLDTDDDSDDDTDE